MKDWIARVPLIVRIYWLAMALLATGLIAVGASLLHWGVVIEAADAPNGQRVDVGGPCSQGPRGGTAGRHRRRSVDGVPYVVVTPNNYRPNRVHPLLVVYAPAGLSPGLSERYSGLTQAATADGFVVTYVGSLQLSLKAVDALAAVPAEVAAGWCIDPTRIYATGHSDGGTMSVALAALPKYQGKMAAIVASGVGWQAADFSAMKCPAPIPVMILHGSEDSHFPGFGRDAAVWWSACNGCTSRRHRNPGSSCDAYDGCSAETLYCEPNRSHWRWAGDPTAIMDFLSRHDERRRGD